MAAVAVLDPEQLRAELKEGNVAPVYLMAGADGFRAERAARWLRERDMDPATAEFNTQTLYADETSPAQIVEAASAYPMFGTMRFVWVRRAEALATGAAIEPLLAYLQNPSTSTRLVFTANKLDKRLKFTAACGAAGRVVGFNALSGSALASQVRRQAKEHGLDLSAEAVEVLLDLVGEDLGEIDMELAKLSLGTADDAGPVGGEEIREYVGRSRDINAFALADELDPARYREALDLWFELRTRGGDVMGCAAILAWRLRQLLQLRHNLDAGIPAKEAGRAAGLSPWQARRVVPLATASSTEHLERVLHAWRQADRRAKSSRVGPELAYDLAILEWAAASAP
jgi:DNA polymerase-3 subunit delta